MTTFRLHCGSCQASLKAPAKLAGKTLKCPKCGHPVKVEASAGAPVEAAAAPAPPAAPAPLAELPPLEAMEAPPADPLADPLADPIAADSLGSAPLPADPLAGDPLAGDPLAAQADVKACPHCLAQIPVQAAKCRHCGEHVAAAAATAPVKPAADQGQEELEPVEYVAAVLVAPIALVLGLVWLLQGSGKARRMLLISAPVALLMTGGLFYFIFKNPGSEFSKNENFRNSNTSLPDQFDSLPPGFDGGEARSSGPDLALLAPPTEDDLVQQPPAQQRAMRANVRIDIEQYGSRSLGSGVVFHLVKDDAWIATNRHVVDPQFAATHGATLTPLKDLPPADVTFVTGDTVRGGVMWLAPDGVDLAIVGVQAPKEGVQPAPWAKDTAITQGQEVFAVGNPAGLGWTLTRGTVSALRRQTVGEATIPVIQTDAAISPGNSGGGLYTSDGSLIGINDFIINPALASNAGFAIRFDFMAELYAAQSKPQ